MTKINKHTIYNHSLIWFCLILFVFFNNPIKGPYISKLVYVVFFFLNVMMAYYMLLLIVFPHFFGKKNLVFVIAYLAVICLFVSIDYLHIKMILPYFGGTTRRVKLSLFPFIKVSFLFFLYIALSSLGSFLGRRSVTRKIENAEKEKSNILKELDFIKNQFNSHLTFNFFNFCYSKIFKSTPAAANSIEEFSEMLHYSLNNNTESVVSLEKEIEYIGNFIAIQKCITANVYVKFNVEGDVKKYFVLPMLLSVFIENAFKHGVLNEINKPITIFISVKNDTILFSVTNEKAIENNIETTGIGLINARQILNLLYKNEHVLTIKETETTYVVELTLKTK